MTVTVVAAVLDATNKAAPPYIPFMLKLSRCVRDVGGAVFWADERLFDLFSF